MIKDSMKNVFTFLWVSLTLFSCNDELNYRVDYKVKSCIKEINRSYASEPATPLSIYKLEDIVKDPRPQLKVSFWHNNSWFYQGVKKHNHFSDTNKFKYEQVDCPDGNNIQKGITDKLKKIDV